MYVSFYSCERMYTVKIIHRHKAIRKTYINS